MPPELVGNKYRPIEGQYGNSEGPWNTQSKMGNLKSLHSGFRELCGQAGSMIGRTREDGEYKGNRSINTAEQTHTHEIRETVKTCTWPSQVWAKWDPSNERSRHKP